MQYICENSVYSYQEQICNGYINLKGGHRVGITGNVVFKENKVVNINYISSLNFRIAKQILGVSNILIKYLLDIENNTIYNTLIVSPPGSRKNNNTKRLYKANK
jgi:stage III sporulation protein AA